MAMQDTGIGGTQRELLHDCTTDKAIVRSVDWAQTAIVSCLPDHVCCRSTVHRMISRRRRLPRARPPPAPLWACGKLGHPPQTKSPSPNEGLYPLDEAVAESPPKNSAADGKQPRPTAKVDRYKGRLGRVSASSKRPEVIVRQFRDDRLG